MMTVVLQPVRRQDVRPLIKLEVAPEQAGFVAPNAVTLAQAPYETGAYVFAIRAKEELVGLVAVVDNREYEFGEPGDDPNSAFLWRLMIGKNYQGQGFGRSAMLEVFNWVDRRGLPKIFTSVVKGNLVATRFYQSLGFALTGRMLENEAEMHLQLNQPLNLPANWSIQHAD